MDIGTGLAVLGSAKVVEKLLGPTADYVGEGMRDWTQRRVANVQRVFFKAIHRLAGKIEEPGAVPPRILKGILSESSFCDDELAAEYFGGILASSRSGIDRDDRGASFIALLGRLSTYQIRAHYILYSVFKSLYDGSGLGLSADDKKKIIIYLPYSAYTTAMDLSDAERKKFVPLLEHVFFGLSRELLLDQSLYGGIEVIEKYLPRASDGGIIYWPSALGAELYLWAHGCSDLGAPGLLDPNQQFQVENTIQIPSGYMRLPGPR